MCDAPGRNFDEKMFAVCPVAMVSFSLNGYGFSGVAAVSLSGCHMQILGIISVIQTWSTRTHLVSSPAASKVCPSSDHESALTHPVLPTSTPSPNSAHRSTSFHTSEFAINERLIWLARLEVVEGPCGGHRVCERRDIMFYDKVARSRDVIFMTTSDVS